MNSFTIKSGTFEGPLDLLISLIEKRKFFINDISLAAVTEDYISYVNALPEYSIRERADFILVATTLILIKSRSLLPTLEITDDEEESIHNLEQRLSEYQKIKELSLHIKERFGKQISFARLEKKSSRIQFTTSPEINQTSLHAYIHAVLQSLPIFKALPQVIVQKIKSLEEVMEDLSNRIRSALQLSFKDMTGEIKSKEDKVNVIVTFLAMLELVKQGVIGVTQHQPFDSIDIETEKIGVPRYL